MTSTTFSNSQLIINKPSGQTPPITCQLAVYSTTSGDGGANLPAFSVGAANTIETKKYLEGATVETNNNGGLLVYGGCYIDQLYWYARFGSNYYYYQLFSNGANFFTGQHKTQPDNEDIKKNLDDYVGKIMSSNDTGYTSHDTDGNKITGADAIYITEALPNCSLSCIDNDPCTFGIVTNAPNGNKPDNPNFLHDSDDMFQNKLYGSVRVNSLGEGAMWVSNINGLIRNGDWITSSRIPGIGKRQDDIFMHNYTVAKATMSCDFDLSSEKYESKTVMFEGQTYIMAYIGVTYHCG
jgi:hypothetical protein